MLESIIIEIKNEDDNWLVNQKYDKLQKLLCNLEWILWKDSLNYNKKLYRIANDFDRIDDLGTRKNLTKKIKEWYYD
jgi:hypothetical protein